MRSEGRLPASALQRHADRCREAAFEDDALVIRWQPFDDVTVETRLSAIEGGHRRDHRIVTGRALHTAEGGFCVPWATQGNEPAGTTAGPGCASAAAGRLASSIVDGPGGTRAGEIVWPMPGSHILFPRTVRPTLRTALAPGTHTLGCEVRVVRTAMGDAGCDPV